MQTFGAYLVALLATSAELASALPQHQRMDVIKARHVGQPGQTLSVPVKRNTATSKKHPAMALAKVYSKYGKEMPTRLRTIVAAHHASKRSTSEGSVTNTPVDYDTEYLANIQIGTPAQTLPMDFDTGSSDLWVFSGETATADVNGQTLYYPSKSSSASKMSGYSWEISYGDGSSSSGDVYSDTVTIGNLTVTSQAVEAATTVSSEFTSDTEMSGLVGLAFSSINTVSPKAQNTFFDNAMANLDQPVFTADLKHDTDGSYNFGYIDSTAYTGDIYYVNLYNATSSYSGYWSFQSTGYAVGDGSTSTTSASTSTSGTGSTGTSSGLGSATTTTTGSSGSDSGSDSGSSPFGSSSGGSSSYGPGGGYGGSGNAYGSGLSEDEIENEISDELSSDWSSWFKRLVRKEKSEARSAPPTRQHAGSSTSSRSVVPASSSSNTEKRAVTLTSTTITGIADTGTTLLMLPDEVVSAYYSQVSDAEDSETEGGYVFSCDQTLPDFTFAVGDGQITVPGDYINWAPVDTTNTTCYGGLQSDADIGLSIFGDIALKAALVVFDGGEKRLGWAAKTTS